MNRRNGLFVAAMAVDRLPSGTQTARTYSSAGRYSMVSTMESHS